VDDFDGNSVVGDIEMDERAGRLSAVIAVVWHGDFAHAIGFKAVIGRSNGRFGGVGHRNGYYIR